MMTNAAVQLEVDASSAIATITLNRPSALNALNLEMANALRDVVKHIEHDPAIRAVIVQGAGHHFMAGGDIKTFHSTLDMPSGAREQLFEQFIDIAHESIVGIRNMQKPVIASVRGAVAGFGLSLMNSCDLAVAADDTYFTMAYCHIGASPDGSGTYGLPRIVGLKRAMEMTLLGDRFDAQHALAVGLINRVVSVANLHSAVRELASRLAAGPTRALARSKQLLNESLSRTLPEQLLAERHNFVACSAELDFGHGLRAFVEKRKPQFEGA